MQKIEQIKLGDSVCDTQYQVRRKINSTTVNEYAEFMRNDVIFPPMVLEEKTNKIICGFTRYEAYKKVFETDELISVVFKSFKKKKDLLIFAAKSNNEHSGQPDLNVINQLLYRINGGIINLENDVVMDKLMELCDKLEPILFNYIIKKKEELG